MRTNHFTLITMAFLACSPALADDAQPVLSLMTDSHVVHVDQPPEVVWAHIKRMYHQGDRYRARGLELTPVTDDPSAYLGGYRGKAPAGSDAPNLEVHFSAVDDENMFLAMYMDGLLPKGIYISHDVDPAGDGSRYQVIIQGFMPVELPDGQPLTAEAVHQWMTARVADHNQGLQEIVNEEIVQALE